MEANKKSITKLFIILEYCFKKVVCCSLNVVLFVAGAAFFMFVGKFQYFKSLTIMSLPRAAAAWYKVENRAKFSTRSKWSFNVDVTVQSILSKGLGWHKYRKYKLGLSGHSEKFAVVLVRTFLSRHNLPVNMSRSAEICKPVILYIDCSAHVCW